MKTTEMHRHLVAKWLSENPNAQEYGFFRSLRALCDSRIYIDDEGYTNCKGLHCIWETYFSPYSEPKELKFVPDAFLICESVRKIVIFEAVDGNDIDLRKWSKLVLFGQSCDEDAWVCDLIVDRKGGRAEYQLCEMWSALSNDLKPHPALLTKDNVMLSAFS
jgi:hypothetical protein